MRSTDAGVSSRLTPEGLLSLLEDRTSAFLIEGRIDLGDVIVAIRREQMKEFFTLVKTDPDFRFNMLSSVTAVDWMDARSDRFELVYHLFSIEHSRHLRVKIPVPERNAEVESLTSLWASANFLEREVWDMYGISFRNHPDLRRILMYEEFVGHPLRKDYPLKGKQPRVRLRYPEVRNTSLDMHRAPLDFQRKKGRPIGA